MRNANARYERIMVPVIAPQQPWEPHVRHASERFQAKRTLLRVKKTHRNGKPELNHVHEVTSTTSHALESCTQAQDGQRCALLTTKSRNTCTRATVFNSSG